MKIKNILSTAAVVSLMALASSAFAVILPVTFTLSVSSNPSNPTPVFTGNNFGTVKMTQVGANEVDFTVTLAAGYDFVNSGNQPTNAFAFNMGSGFAVALTGTTATSNVYQVGAGPAANQTGGLGSYTDGIQFTDAAKNGQSGNYTAPITFKVTKATGVSYSDFEVLNAAGYMFTADIGKVGTALTGNVATGFKKTTADGDPSIPEPTTIALLGLGLLGVALARRRKN